MATKPSSYVFFVKTPPPHAALGRTIGRAGCAPPPPPTWRGMAQGALEVARTWIFFSKSGTPYGGGRPHRAHLKVRAVGPPAQVKPRFFIASAPKSGVCVLMPKAQVECHACGTQMGPLANFRVPFAFRILFRANFVSRRLMCGRTRGV